MIDSLNRFEELSGGRYLTSDTRVNTDDSVLRGFIRGTAGAREDAYRAVNFVDYIPEPVIARINAAFGGAFVQDAEGYAIVLDEDITIYAPSARGHIYGANDLTRMAKGGFIPQGIVYNRPSAEFRCLKVYLPPEENIGFFKEVIDMCCYYRINTLIVEVGGAMEYKRHPEINEGWVAYCDEMHEYSGKTTIIQEHTFPWGKNSIHCENGGGKFLSQAQVRDIVDYCKRRGIDIIPEMPTLSHCDYLLTRHPEFAERQNDPYPDTYCPNLPGVYEYVFDVLDEVIEVFEPKTMHIGHDEFYSVGICERCKDIDAAELYANDVIRIHDFLQSRGVRTLMWSEKLLNSITKGGRHVGGSEKRYMFKGEFAHRIPATYTAIDMIPRDIICMHWYWSIIEKWDYEFLGRDFYTFFGNYTPMAMPNATQRLAAGVKGGGPSNWSYATMEYLQENNVLMSMAYASMLFWKEGHTDDQYTDYLAFCFQDLFAVQSRGLLAEPHIDILHTTSHYRKHITHADGVFIDYDADTVGKYVVEYDDGSSFDIPVVYGQNITNKNRVWTRSRDGLTGGADMGGDSGSNDYECYIFDNLLCAVSYSTLPVRIGEETYFRCVVANPHPEKNIKSITALERPGMEGKLLVKEIKY